MRVKFKANDKGIKSITKNAQMALEQAAEATKTDVISAQVIPFDIGTTQNEQTFIDRKDSAKGIVRIVTDSPQARRLYFHPEYDFQVVNNKNAKAGWFNDWINGKNKEFAINAFALRLRKLNERSGT